MGMEFEDVMFWSIPVVIIGTMVVANVIHYGIRMLNVYLAIGSVLLFYSIWAKFWLDEKWRKRRRSNESDFIP